jgi:putative hydrolase of the HAD superfamily
VGTVVFFDLVGTLIRARTSIGSQYAEIAGGFGITADARALDRAFPAVLARSPTFALPDPDEADLPGREKRAWRAIVETVFREAGPPGASGSPGFDACFEELFRHFATRDAWDLYPDVVPALARLRRAGHRVGLISNFDSRVFPLLNRLGIASSLDSVTIPATAGVAKPDPEIFLRALAAHGAAAAEAICVGDSVDEDLVPARGLGMTAILIDRGGRRRAPQGVRRIRSLARLSPLVRSAETRDDC